MMGQKLKWRALINYLVGTGQKCRREIERSCRLCIDDQLELGRQVEWKIAGFAAVEDLMDIVGYPLRQLAKFGA